MSASPPPSRGELGLWAVRGAGFGAGLLGIAALAMVGREALGVAVLVLVVLLLAAAIEPLVLALRDRLGLSRVKIILGLYVLLAALAIAFAAAMVPALTEELMLLAERLPGMLADGREWVTSLEPPVLATLLGQIIDALDATLSHSGISSPEPETLLAVGLTAADAALAALSVLTMIFFWLISRATIQRFALSMVTLERRHELRTAWNEIERRLGQWLRGQLTVMLVVGAASTVAYVLLGLPNALMLGVFAGLAEVIPIIGPAIGAIPALVTALLAGGPELAAIVVVVYIVIQVVEGQVLVPIVMRNTVGVPPFLVILALLVGGAVGGIAGALLAVPLAAIVIVVLEHAQARKRAVGLATPDIASTAVDEPDGELSLPDDARRDRRDTRLRGGAPG